MEYNGKIYNNYRSLSEHLGISSAALMDRVSMNIPLDTPLLNYKKVVYNGVEFKSNSELARYLGIKIGTLHFRLKNKLAPDQSHDNNWAKPITYKGIKYPSKTALANAFGLSICTMKNRLKSNIPLESPPLRNRKTRASSLKTSSALQASININE